jgi:hypothetical protein
MSHNSNIPPFSLGETYKGKDGATLINGDLLGQEFEFPVETLVNGVARRVNGRVTKARIVRNESGGALTGGNIVATSPAAGVAGTVNITGAASAAKQRNVYIVDPDLPTAGVADDDLFFVIIEGPSRVRVPSGGLSVTAGQWLHTTDAGRAAVTTTAADAAYIMGTMLQTVSAGANALVPVDVKLAWA